MIPTAPVSRPASRRTRRELGPTGPDLYGTLEAPFGTTEDRYIQAIQSRVVDVGSRKVVHHALSYAVDPDDDAGWR